jgi:hypothetical protein
VDSTAHRRSLAPPAQQIVLQDYVSSVADAAARVAEQLGRAIEMVEQPLMQGMELGGGAANPIAKVELSGPIPWRA